jgi:hypothetical protein
MSYSRLPVLLPYTNTNLVLNKTEKFDISPLHHALNYLWISIAFQGTLKGVMPAMIEGNI